MEGIEREIQKSFMELLKTQSYEDLLSHLLYLTSLVERKIYLQNNPDDKAGGFRNRKLSVGSLNLNLTIPRTRKNGYRPFFLPEKWKRHSETDYINLVYSLILSCKSIQAAKRSLKEIGLSYSEEYFDSLLKELREELEALNKSPLNPDWFALIMDAKEIKVKQETQIISYTVYTITGISLEGRKKILLTQAKEGRESLKDWKEILTSLLNRGVRRVLTVVHDDFSGLCGITASYFPKADVQLCIVHLLRNGKKHFSAKGYQYFKKMITAIKSAPNYEYASILFDKMCEELQEENKSYVKRMMERKENYLAFLKYPEEVRSVISSTNLAEGINRKIENVEQYCGGYFHSLENLKVKLSIVVKELHEGRWKKPTPNIAKVSNVLYAMFARRFDDL